MDERSESIDEAVSAVACASAGTIRANGVSEDILPSVRERAEGVLDIRSRTSNTFSTHSGTHQ